SPRDFYQFITNAEASRPMFGGRVHVTGQIKFEHYHEDSSVATHALGGALTDFQDTPYAFRRRTLEGGLDYDRSLGPWDLTLSGLATRIHFASDVSSTDSGPSGAINSVFRQDQVQDSGETIVRATLARASG